MDETPVTAADVAADPVPWRARAGAFVIDMVPGTGVLATAAIAALTLPRQGLWWWVVVVICAATILGMATNRLILPVTTGWSLGRAVYGITVVHRDGGPAGPWRLLLRDAAHLVDTAPLFLGWLLPLWDARRRTVADLLARTEARGAQPPARGLRRSAAALSVVAALLCVAISAGSFLVVYRQDRVADRARADITRQGPKIVVEMLSYTPETIDDDFAHAQTLTTEKYREQLTAGQQAAKKAPIAHAYLVPNSAVLAATPERAAMLIFLRGELGAPPQVWNSTATVRVEFVKAPEARWLVDDLTFVPKPQHGDGGR